VVADVLGQEHLHAIIKHVVEMLRTTCHTVIKALVKFTLVGLLHDDTFNDLFETLYNFSDFLEHF